MKSISNLKSFLQFILPYSFDNTRLNNALKDIRDFDEFGLDPKNEEFLVGLFS